jgi:hypothetical protein
MQATTYGSNFSGDTDRGPSKAVWKDLNVLELIADPSKGCYFFDDFMSIPITPATTEGNFGQYAQFSDTGGTVTDGATLGGAISIGSDGDNEGCSIRTLVAPYQLVSTGKDFWFEARVKSSTIADTKHNIFIGLMENTALTATVPITAAGAIADKNLVGFFRPETARTVAGTGGAIMNTCYKADSVTAVNVQTDAITLVADTYIKLGMKFQAKTGLLTFFSNGVACSTTKAVPVSGGTDFPSDTKMGLVFAVLNATASTPGTSTIDWWRVAQLF